MASRPIAPNFVRNLLFAALLGCFAVPAASAHSAPGSAVMFDFGRDGVAAELTLPLQELEIAFKHPLMDEPSGVLTRYEPELREYLLAHIHPVAPDGREWSVDVGNFSLQLSRAPFDLVARVWMKPPEGAPVRRFTFNYDVIAHEVNNHFAVVFVRNDWNNAVFSEQPEPLGMIQFTVKTLEVDRVGGSWWRGFRSVVILGIHHIAAGTDHLLFLLVLLLPAPLLVSAGRWAGPDGVMRSLWRLLSVVSSFTMGHSITLVVGALDWVRVPAQPVEVLIAVSILVSAVHAARPCFAGRETWIAGGFGLVHGLAFAGSVARYGFSPWYMALTIFGFNVGIELMQLAVVVVTVPWLLLLSRTRLYRLVRLGGATFAALAATGWAAERVLVRPNVVSEALESLSPHAAWAVAALAAFASGAYLWQRLGPVES